MVLGIDIGGTKLTVAAVDGDGRIHARVKEPVAKESPAATAAQVERLAGSVVEGAGLAWGGIAAAGACVPGICYPATGDAWAPNLWGRDRVPFRRELEARLTVPVRIESDRAAYVFGEQWLGAARGMSDVVFLAVGTGIGAGILSGGRLVRGVSDIAGAVGWFALNPALKPRYREVGCFEAEAAGPGLALRFGALSAEEVVAAARAGDQRAKSALAETAHWLAMGIANLISALNPEIVVLGGGLMRAGDLLLEPIRREVLDWAQPIAARETRIELTQLGEDAGLLGAAKIALGV